MRKPLFPSLNLALPLIQAPMAGVSTPRLAAAVSNAGALGSIAVGHLDPERARAEIRQTRALTERPFQVNLFCHQPARRDPAREEAWLSRLGPLFQEFGARPPERLEEIYRSFSEDAEMLQVLLEERPALVSFHFGLPPAATISALRAAGILLLASATNPSEAGQIEAAGLDGIVAQGIEAGGHRGVFDPEAEDERLSTAALTRRLVQTSSLPIVAAGGIMDGADIRAALNLGAAGVQLGTAFVGCPESAAGAGYRELLSSPAAQRTEITVVVSGRPARSLPTRFVEWGRDLSVREIPAYPLAYAAGKALAAAARARGQSGYDACWAGQGASRSRNLPAAQLIQELIREMEKNHEPV